MPIELCDTASLCDERGMVGHMWESIALTPRVLDSGHPEILFWMYVDTDVKDDHQFGFKFDEPYYLHL